VSILKGSKEIAGESAAKDAQRALEEGRSIFVWQSAKMMGDLVRGTAEAIEAIEAVGWHLEHVSHYFDTRGLNRAVGIFTFRKVG
jgi:hypothetical protein